MTAPPHVQFALSIGHNCITTLSPFAGDPSVCFMSVVDMLGNKLPPVCAVGGALTLNITDAPTYAAVFNWDTAG